MVINRTIGIKIAGMSTTIPEASSVERFDSFTEVKVRKSGFEQTASDLAFNAAQRLLTSKEIDLEEIGAVLFLSRTPDYRSPNTAAILQGRLGLSIDCICYDINKGSNGFQSGIITGASILNTINKKYALVLIGDTPSKFTATGFFSKIDSDAATAVLLEKDSEGSTELISGHLASGEEFKAFSVPKGGFRFYNPQSPFDATKPESFELIFNETQVKHFLEKHTKGFLEEINKHIDPKDSVIYHSQLALLTIIPNSLTSDSVIKEYGNTYGSNIPLQMAQQLNNNSNAEPVHFSCIGFGEGLELSFLKLSIDSNCILPTAVSTEFFKEYRVSHEI
ncbi:MAG: hypothetical protein EP332_05850 [Bacteroidetes bacterium]|nr:MAG: hypothetical protein EP332_05850 [Bacteroidota bacterium]